MLNTIVSFADTALAHAVFEIATAFWRAPLACTLFFAAVAGAAVTMLAQVFEAGDPVPREDRGFENRQPIRLKR